MRGESRRLECCMRRCPWCGRQNLNVYAYCQSCGRGFDGPGEDRLAGFWTEYVGAWLVPATEGASPWPIFAAIAALLFGPLLAWHAQTDAPVAAPLAGAAAAAGVFALLAWFASSLAEGRGVSRPGPVTMLESTFVVAAWMDSRELRQRLMRLHGVGRAVVEASDLQTTAVVNYESTTSTDAMVAVMRDRLAPRTNVTVFEPRKLGEFSDPRVRMGLAPALAAVVGVALGGLAATGAFAALQSDGGTTGPAGPLPGEGVTTVVARDIKFVQQVVRVAPGATVTLTLDNQDTGVPHNIEFFDTPKAGEGALLEGCTEGCKDGGTVLSTEIESGPAMQAFTFIAPAAGRYGFWCVVHPTTMTGTLIVEEPAAPAGTGS
jgi:plastocyanin